MGFVPSDAVSIAPRCPPAAINVFPDADLHVHAALVRQSEQHLHVGTILALLLRRQPNDLDVRKAWNIEEIWIRRRHVAALLVAEREDDADRSDRPRNMSK